MKRITLLYISSFLLLGVGCNGSNVPEKVSCTMEAKICPDGSAVARSGPRCEFSACPDTKNDMIRVDSPRASASIKSPLHIQGEARGTWYFEADFPIKLIDSEGNTLGSAIATAQTNWMTEAFVPFMTDLTFTEPRTNTGTLILEKNNPSGLPEHADELRIPITFESELIPVTLFYYQASQDTDETGNILCSQKGLVSVVRQLPKTLTPIQDTVRELLHGNLTPDERQRGITTEFPLEDVELRGVSLKDGVLTLELTDPQHKTSGGACRATILRLQIEATAKQFSGVKEVRFQPSSLFQP